MHLAVSRSTLRALFALPLLALPTVAAAGGAFMFKGGQMILGDTTQTLDGLTRTFDDDSYGTLAVAIESRKPSGVSFGGEFMTYTNDFTPPLAEPGMGKTWVLQFVGKKYFIEGGPVHPFFGGGIGLARVHFEHRTGGIEYTDEEVSLTLQALVGVELRFDNLAFSLEAKHMYHDIQTGGNEYDPTATGVFAGFGFTW